MQIIRKSFFASFAFLACILSVAVPASVQAVGSGLSGDPYTTLSDAYRVGSSGRYYFNLGSGLFQADVDNSEGGGWVLTLQYGHEGGTSPALSVLGAGADMPVASTAALGTDESGDATKWGHAGNAAMSQFTGDIELRWYGETSGHGRKIHFRSTVGDDYWRTGTGNASGIQSNFTTLTGHTANLPGSASNFRGNAGDNALPYEPFFTGSNYHWNIGFFWYGQNRWEVDDWPDNDLNDTIHRIWVRQANPLQVVNTNDSGTGSLRQAMTVANTSATLDAITFDIPGMGPLTINPTSALPLITDDGISIDGTTQSGAACGQLSTGTQHSLQIQIDGAIAGTNTAGFNIGSTTNTMLKGLSVTNFEGTGISISSSASSAIIECSYIGVATDGTTKGPNATSTAFANNIRAGTANDVNIINNLISGNDTDTNDDGIRFVGTTNSTIKGNIIGLNAAGTAQIGNADDGIQIDGSASGITIGGETAADRNIISGNGDNGINIDGASNITVIGNYIGLGVDGTTSLGNNNAGILMVNASSITVGNGTTAGRNIVAGNTGSGLFANGTTNSVTVQGNYVGTDSSGLLNRGNGAVGIGFNSASNATIGGTTPGHGNVIAGSGFSGIALELNASDILIEGNFIGLGADGTTAIGNGNSGVWVRNSSARIGNGDASGANRIANNNFDGVSILDTSSAAVIGNEIFSNNNLGIVIGTGDVNTNDGGDGDSGPNDLLNFPVINEIGADGSTSVGYDITLDVPAHGNGYRIEFFSTTNPDATNGEGETYLGAIDASGPGTWTGSFTATSSVGVGESISATTTRKTAAGFDITSEFSVNVISSATISAEMVATKSVEVIDDGLIGGDNTVAIPGATLRYTITIRNDGAGTSDADSVVITDSVPSNGSFKVSNFNGTPGAGPVGVTQGSPSSGLTYSYTSLASGTDDLEFSNNDGTSWTYIPTDSGDGTDPSITHIRVSPGGSFNMNGGTPPSINMKYEVVLF